MDNAQIAEAFAQMSEADKALARSQVHPYIQEQLKHQLDPAVGTFKFRLGEEVKHKPTGGVYIIVGLPNENIMKEGDDWVHAYAYLMADGRTAHRSQLAMEDGRFESVPEGSAIEYHKTWAAMNAAPTPMSKKVDSAVTFEDFIEIGKAANPEDLHNGLPWSFTYKGHPVTHCDDDKYSIATPEGGFLLFHRHRGEMLIEVEGKLCVMKTQL
jgi:hypothetical protein